MKSSQRSVMSVKSSKSKKSAKAPKPPKELKDLVKKKDRLTHEEVFAYLVDLLDAEKRVADPLDDIEAIFDKIQAWKQKFGDLEQ